MGLVLTLQDLRRYTSTVDSGPGAAWFYHLVTSLDISRKMESWLRKRLHKTELEASHRGVFLISGLSRQVVLGFLRRQAEQTIESEPVSNIPPQSLPWVPALTAFYDGL